MGVLLSAHIHKQGEEGKEGNRFAAALTRTLNAARMSSPYITADTDWREKPFRFIIALETVVAGSEPTLLATATPMSWFSIQEGVRKNASPHFRLFSSYLPRQEQAVG